MIERECADFIQGPSSINREWFIPHIQVSLSDDEGVSSGDSLDAVDPKYNVMVTGLAERSVPSPPGGQIHVHMSSPEPTGIGAAPALQTGHSQAAQPEAA
ncbi:expressed unknown protein [Seminavis robusta]|uniref:Uncharacterized protein n=1 Tax=Seminavis robusta TaxID=568900 RepID=A0A9N8DXU6_9STRA|nr:expressed unknown protein [Seminavis robusta]|eukprot:Sro327_g118280.1 n/a (100) ;mRNA; r:8539-8923